MQGRCKCLVCDSLHHIAAVHDAAVLDRWGVLELLGLVVQHLEAADIVLEEVSERAVVGVLACTDLLIEDILPACWVVQRSEIVVSLVDQIVEGVNILTQSQGYGLHHVSIDLLQGPEQIHPVSLKVW